MILADAIERYALANRASLDSSEKELFRLIWSTVRMSEAADLDLETMTRDDSDLVMVLFDKPDRPRIADTLNAVRAWSVRRRVSTGSAPERRATRAASGGATAASSEDLGDGHVRRHDDEAFAADRPAEATDTASNGGAPDAVVDPEESAGRAATPTFTDTGPADAEPDASNGGSATADGAPAPASGPRSDDESATRDRVPEAAGAERTRVIDDEPAAASRANEPEQLDFDTIDMRSNTDQLPSPPPTEPDITTAQADTATEPAPPPPESPDDASAPDDTTPEPPSPPESPGETVAADDTTPEPSPPESPGETVAADDTTPEPPPPESPDDASAPDDTTPEPPSPPESPDDATAADDTTPEPPSPDATAADDPATKPQPPDSPDETTADDDTATKPPPPPPAPESGDTGTREQVDERRTDDVAKASASSETTPTVKATKNKSSRSGAKTTQRSKSPQPATTGTDPADSAAPNTKASGDTAGPKTVDKTRRPKSDEASDKKPTSTETTAPRKEPQATTRPTSTQVAGAIEDRSTTTTPSTTSADAAGTAADAARIADRRAAAKTAVAPADDADDTPVDEPPLFSVPFTFDSLVVPRPGPRPPEPQSKLYWVVGGALVAIGMILLLVYLLFLA